MYMKQYLKYKKYLKVDLKTCTSLLISRLCVFFSNYMFWSIKKTLARYLVNCSQEVSVRLKSKQLIKKVENRA